MDEAMRRVAEDVGREVARRMVVMELRGREERRGGEGGRGEGGEGKGGEGERKRVREMETRIVNPRRRVEQAWVGDDG